MIGIIGPKDSVNLALEAATTDDLQEQVIGHAYDDIDQALGIARELDQLCRVLLFTGTAPFTLVSAEDGWRSVLDHVQHTSVDLAATVVRLLRDFQGVLPTVSLDTIESSEAGHAFDDMGLPAPQYVLPLRDDHDDIRSSDELVDAHRQLYEASEVEVCLTCLGAVHRDLSSHGIPSYRVEHTKSSVRDAIRRAARSSVLARSEAIQMAMALVEVPGLKPGSSGQEALYEAQRLRLRVQESLLDFAEELRGSLAPLDEQTFVIHTTRGPVEDALHRYRRGYVSPIEPDGLPTPATVGYGLGFSVADAEKNARRAIEAARRTGMTSLVFSDGRLVEVARDADASTIDEIAANEELGLGRLAVSRLLAALRRLDITDITTNDLATAYGVAPRSARRLLSQLEDAGVATELPSRSSPGPGRPRKRYEISTERLLELLGHTADDD